MAQYKYKFSVIIPVYNVEEYLEETIQSVLYQTIGFEDNIQLILVNDGSPDNSDDICKKYRDMFPNNVVYVHQKNSGVSAARNKGMEYIEGEIVNFLDSDDKWDRFAFQEVYKYSKKYENISLFSCKMVFFDAKKGRHPLNYKYKKNRVINILEDYDYPQLSSSSIFIRSRALKGHKYDTSIRYSEDNKFINEILFDELNYMVLKKPTYYYRRRSVGDSAIQGQVNNADWFLVTPKYVYSYLFDLSREKFGKLIPYIQYLVMYDLNWRLKIEADALSTKEKNEYIKIITKLINMIDDNIVCELKNIEFTDKISLLGFKKNKDYIKDIEYDGEFVRFEDMIISQKHLGLLLIDNIYFKNDKMFLFGKLDIKFIPQKSFKVKKDGKNLKVNFYELPVDYNTKIFDGTKIHDYVGFTFNININDCHSLEFFFGDNILIPRFKKWSVFCEKLPRSYHYHGKRMIYFKKDRLIFAPKNRFKAFFYEIANDIKLLRIKKIKVVAIRVFIKLARLFKHKKIMLISDRINVAGDNGEHFFKYMLKNHPEYKSYFVLANTSSDYERMKSVGEVLDPQSLKYKLIFQICDYIVSSQAENYIFNILGKNNSFVQDQYYFKFVFLQHGIIKDDLSPWTNIHSKKIDMYVTSCNQEYQSLLDYKYYFGKNIVKLTGLPRYDNLLKLQEKTPVKKQILLSCTWRAFLANKINRKTGERLYNPDFKNSNYFIFLNNLINDERLLKVLRKNDYKIKFCVHPNVVVQLEDFKENDCIIIEKNAVNYQKEFCENALLITDYSSVFFDFAYLKKPVIYLQHDRKEFFEGQLYNEGYFDYNKMGFGPVCKNLDQAVNAIIECVENGCKLEKKYANRIDSFFTYHDDKNCERVFKEIEKL